MSRKERTKINSVLARFEETIEQNNAVGVCSGMYLTTQVTKKGSLSPSRAPSMSRRHSTTTGSNPVVTGSNIQRRMSTADVKPGVYREMLSGKPSAPPPERAPKEGEDGWDPFGKSDSNLSHGSEDDSDDDGSVSSAHKKEKLQRPKTQRSAGRRAIRKTRTKGAASIRRKHSSHDQPSSVDTCTTKSESDSEQNEDDGSDDDSAFSLTYVGDAREKYAALQRQTSDKRLNASKIPRSGGLEMTRQDSSRSLTRQKKSRGSGERSKSSRHSRGGDDESSVSNSVTDLSLSPKADPKRYARSSGDSRSKEETSNPSRRTSSRHNSSRSNVDAADSSAPRRSTTSRSSIKSSRNFSKSRNS